MSKHSFRTRKSKFIKPDIANRIITFNCLSPYYTSNEYFPNCNPKHLSKNYRIKKLIERLSGWVKSESEYIICLQEVCGEWSQIILEYFKNNEYIFYYVNYSDNKMGVGIAFPHKHYKLINKDLFTPSESAKNKVEKVYEYCLANSSENVNLESSAANDTIDDNSIDVIDNYNIEDLTTICGEYYEGGNSDNVQLTLILGIKTNKKTKISNMQKLIVSTYHSPCKYDNNPQMILNIRESMGHLWNISLQYKTPYIIYCGDFNVVKNSNIYFDLLNTIYNYTYDMMIYTDFYRVLEEDLSSFPKFVSSHYMCNGYEPEFTNIHVNETSNFKDTLDYILVTSDIELKSSRVGLIPENDITPNAICPSDHLPLSATFALK